MAFWRLDRRVPWRNSNSIRASFREGRGGLREQKQAIRSSARAHRTPASALTNAPNLNAAPGDSEPVGGSGEAGQAFHRTAQMVAEPREAIRELQQTIDETRELMRRLDLVIEHELVLKRT